MEYQFKGKYLKVSQKIRQLPNSHSVTIDIIEHPGAVLIVPFLNRNELLFLYQYRPALEKYLYELPAGTLNPGESPLACAKRELIEETGYAAGKITRIAHIYPVPGYSTEIITIFRAQNLKEKPDTGYCDPDEVIKLCPMRLSQIRTIFRKGKICDAKSICALTFCGIL